MSEKSPSIQAVENLVLEALDELKARDIISLDVHKISSITHYMIICTANSSRQGKAISDHVVEKAKAKNCFIGGVEGTDSAEWILVDLGVVVVHIMQEATREFYQLERLWDTSEAG